MTEINLSEELVKLQEKAKKYEYWKENNSRVVERVKFLLNELNEILGMIEPNIVIKQQRTGIRKKRSEELEELYNSMLSGTNITSDLIIKTYGIDSKNTIRQIMAKLLKMPRVQRVKDGTKVRLFVV